jgi:hypothetical protein
VVKLISKNKNKQRLYVCFEDELGTGESAKAIRDDCNSWSLGLSKAKYINVGVGRDSCLLQEGVQGYFRPVTIQPE